jgi:hypothetical protein
MRSYPRRNDPNIQSRQFRPSAIGQENRFRFVIRAESDLIATESRILFRRVANGGFVLAQTARKYMPAILCNEEQEIRVRRFQYRRN